MNGESILIKQKYKVKNPVFGYAPLMISSLSYFITETHFIQGGAEISGKIFLPERSGLIRGDEFELTRKS